MFETNKYHVFSKHAFLAMDSSMGGFGHGLAKAIFARLQAEAEKSEDPLWGKEWFENERKGQAHRQKHANGMIPHCFWPANI